MILTRRLRVVEGKLGRLEKDIVWDGDIGLLRTGTESRRVVDTGCSGNLKGTGYWVMAPSVWDESDIGIAV